jgi:hypothetical protein
MSSTAALAAKLDAAAKSSKAELTAIQKRFDDVQAQLPGLITNALKDALLGQTALLQATMETAQRDIQAVVENFKTEILDTIQRFKEQLATLQHEADELQRASDQTAQLAQQAMHSVNKAAASANQPHPSMIREIKERISNEPNLILSPVSDTILEPNLPLHVVQIINTNTNLSLSATDVVSVKRLGRAGSQFKGVRVTFSSSQVRNKVFNERRKFGKQQGDAPAVFLNPDLTRSQQEHKRRMLPLFKHIRDANRQAGIQGKTPFFDEELLHYFPNPQSRMGPPVLHPANFDEQALAAAMPANPSTSAAAQA